MNTLNYILQAFGFYSFRDYLKSSCGYMVSGNVDIKLFVFSILGALKLFLFDGVGFDMPVLVSFVLLIVAEFWSGLKVSRKIKGQKFKSRPFARMLIKIGTYVFILYLLNQFAKSINAPDVMGLEMNPFTWLYYTVFVAIVFQLLISYMENLGALGYKESKTISGFLLRRLNNWFEFDGTKNNNLEEDDFNG